MQWFFKMNKGPECLFPLKGGTYQPCQHPALEMLNIKKSRDGGGKETNNLF